MFVTIEHRVTGAPEEPDPLRRVHVRHDPVHVPRRVGAQVVHGDLVGPERQDVVLHRVGRDRGQLAVLVGMYVLRGSAFYLERDPSRAGRTRMPGKTRQQTLDPLLAPSGNGALSGIWGAILQAFTVDDVVQRKVK